MDAGLDIVALAAVEHLLKRRHHPVVGLVAARRMAIGDREIGRPDIDRIEPMDRQDLVKLVDRLGGLDHAEGDDEVVGLHVIIRPAVERGADRPRAPIAERRIAAGADEFLCFGAVVDHRADDAVGAGVERLLDVGRVVPRDAHQRHRAGGRDALQHRHHDRVVDHAVLHVDDQRIPAGMGHNLGREARRNPQPAIDDGPALRPDLPHSVRARHLTLHCAALSSPDPASYRGMCQASWPRSACPHRRRGLLSPAGGKTSERGYRGWRLTP